MCSLTKDMLPAGLLQTVTLRLMLHMQLVLEAINVYVCYAGSGSSTNGAAIALGVLLGVVCCLLFLTLFLLVRDRRRRRETTESDSETGTQVCVASR